MIETEDEARGIIRATVKDAKVTITVKPVTRETVQLKVRARRMTILPSVQTAHEVYFAITDRL
ncbi:MAG TPA: hypothetical protein VGB20_07350 [bacterium]